MQLIIHPVIAAKGDKLFDVPLHEAKLKLTETRKLADGLVKITYVKIL